MNSSVETNTISKEYIQLSKQLDALLTGESNLYANLSNASALLNQFFDRINWVGFYLMEEGELVLGPFQGLPACVRIAVGKGVCGTAVESKESIIVPDVHAFPGHTGAIVPHALADSRSHCGSPSPRVRSPSRRP